MKDRFRWIRRGGGVVALAIVTCGISAFVCAAPDTTQPAATQTIADLPLDRLAHTDITNLPAPPVTPESAADLRTIQARAEAVVKEAVPATVGIILPNGQGSGVIVSKDGYVLTAGHVSGRPNQNLIVILANGKEVHAKSLGANNNIDSGLIRITDKGDYPFVPVGTAKNLVAGQWVLALGHPLGYRADRPPVVRLGRVLAANDKLIGTDCTLINGDSGGPLFDLDGRLIGINSRIGMVATANIHVPIDTFIDTWDRLAKAELWGDRKTLLRGGRGPSQGSGKERPAVMFGVTTKDDPKGAFVLRVRAGTPAENANLMSGDIVTQFAGKAIANASALSTAIASCKPGDHVTVNFLRSGTPATADITIAAWRDKGGGE